MKSITYVEKLTKDKEAMMPEYAKKWIETGLKTGETDWETFDKYMPLAYKKAGLKYPKNIVRVASPMIGALASMIADGVWRKGGAVGDAVGGAVRDAVGDAVDDAVRDAVDDAVGGAVGDAVDDAVRGAVGDAVGDAVRGAVHGAVRGAVGDAVHGAVGDAVGDAVRDAVRGAVDDAVRGAVDPINNYQTQALNLIKTLRLVGLGWHYWLGGQFWVGGWYYGNAFVNFFFDICGLKLNKDIMERAEAYRKINESVNYIWANKNFVMVCARPKKIERNTQGQLHCTNGKAIEYPDGWGLYFLNGVRFEEELYKKVTSGNMPFEEILAIPDIDQRTQAMRFGNVRKFLKHTKSELIDKYSKYTLDGVEIKYELHMIPKGEIFQTDAYYVVYDCPSTQKVYMSGVTKEVAKSVPEAMAWKQFISAETWKNMIPLVHES